MGSDYEDTGEEMMHQLRSKATELLLREEFKESTSDSNHLQKLNKSLCLTFSNRAEGRFRLKEYADAIKDCDQALKIDDTHFKTLVCKGKILLNLNKYSMAYDCLKKASTDSQARGFSENLNGYLDLCKRFVIQSKTGVVDVSDWVLSGFKGIVPEFAEYVGAIEIKKSDLGGRGLFSTKNIDMGTVLLVTKAIATERVILPNDEDYSESVQLVMWKNFVDKVMESVKRCDHTHHLIRTLSTGEDENRLEVPNISLFWPETEETEVLKENVPNISLFWPETEETEVLKEKFDVDKILNVLDGNSIVEDSISGKILRKNSGYHGVGLWVLASFINHSCVPNARRIHIRNHVIVLASRDVKAGEDITFAYFDVLSPLNKRREMSMNWGFSCACKRCKFEDEIWSRQELGELQVAFEEGLLDMGSVVFRLEEGMKKWVVRGKEKGYLRSSFWEAFLRAFESEKLMKRWGRRIPAMEVIFDSIVDVVGGDEIVLKVLVEGLKRSGGGNSVGGTLEMERVMKLGRGVYGKMVKRQALKALLGLGTHDHS
ncbi:LOW QUALITY PROTEIN: SET domain [Dillenia turbinata]|uniref:SET domain n=1 Tax=Dillenia turbinata TaxID=194707 RepID=A0AAN8UWG5_9MAGN